MTSLPEWTSEEIVEALRDEIVTWPRVGRVRREKVNSTQSLVHVVTDDGRRFRITVDGD